MIDIPTNIRQYIAPEHAYDFEPWQAAIESRIEDDLKKQPLVKTTFPRSFLEWWTKSPTKREEIESHDRERALWLVHRYRCLYDHIFLGGFVEAAGTMEPILGMDFQENPHKMMFAQLLKKQPGATINIEDPVTHTMMQVPIPLSDLDTRYKKRMVLWPRGLFKALDCNTELPTPLGFRQISEIHVGDTVFDESGKSCQVVGESPIYLNRPCCEVEFSTGDKIVCDEDHLWMTDAHTDIRHKLGSGQYSPATQKTTERKKERRPSVKTTKQIAETLHYGNKKNHNHSVVVAQAIEYPDREFIIHPYVLGAWLGDGTSSKPEITIGPEDRQEMVQHLAKYEPIEFLREKQGTSTYRFGLRSQDLFLRRLRNLDILTNKHIPDSYLQGSILQRLELLRGLMDTDGTVFDGGTCSFSGTNQRLVDGVRELVASLGMKPSEIHTYNAYVGTSDNRSGDCAPVHVFVFTAYNQTPIFKLSRKFQRQAEEPKIRGLQKNRMIVAVRPVISRPVKCIMVDSPNHLYLAGRSYIPTHNTSAVIVEMVQCILNYPNIRLCFLTGSDSLAKDQCRRLTDIFEKPSKVFQFLFPEFTLKSVLNKRTSKWTEVNPKMGDAHQFTVPCRTNRTMAQPTFAISTAKSVKTGAHFDIIFIDDLVNEQNYKSIPALEKCYQQYKDICPLLDPTGFMILTGTRYSYGDTYEKIQEAARKEEKDRGKTIWKFSIRDCWSRSVCGCGHTDCMHDIDINIAEPPCTMCDCPGLAPNQVKGVLFPETRTFDGRSIGHTLEFLAAARADLGPESFANQYENNPVAQGTQTFTAELIAQQTLFHLEQLPPYQQSETFAIADLAYVGQPDRDFSVIYVCRKFMGQIFVFDCVWGHWDSSKVAENIVNVILKHRPKMVYPERFNGWEAYDTIIRAHALQRGLQIVPIEWLKGSQQANAKLARIGAINGPLTSRRLWLFNTMEKFDVLCEQLIKWPKLGRNDDFADCLGQVVAAPTGYQLESIPVDESGINWLHRLHQSTPLDESYYDGGCGTGFCC